MAFSAVVLGILYGPNYGPEVGEYIVEMSAGSNYIVGYYMVLALAFAGCLGALFNGAVLIKSAVKPVNRKVIPLTLDLISIVFLCIGLVGFFGAKSFFFDVLTVICIGLCFVDALYIIIGSYKRNEKLKKKEHILLHILR